MAKLIALFNHKGGVSKTTTTFNLGWALAEKGKNVIIVDGDPQCNLTGNVLGFSGRQEFEDFYSSSEKSDLNSCLEPVFQGSQNKLAPASLTSTDQPGLSLLAGHIDLAESESQLAVAVSTGASAIPALQNLPGSISHLLRLTADEHDADVVLIDMSPSVGALNQCFLMGADYFIVPTLPDYFCDQAVQSLGRILPRWNKAITPFRGDEIEYPLPDNPPKFIGTISQRYRPYGGSPASSFQRWIDQIKETVRDSLVPGLRQHNMTISEAQFHAADADDSPYNLINIAEFNSLVAISQEHNTPVFALTDDQIDRHGKVLDNMTSNRDSFQESFNSLAETTSTIVGL